MQADSVAVLIYILRINTVTHVWNYIVGFEVFCV